MIPNIKYRGFATHDPYAAEKAYQEMFGVKPTALVIRPGYPVDKFHPLLYESRYGTAIAILATHEATVKEIKAIEVTDAPKKDFPKPSSNYIYHWKREAEKEIPNRRDGKDIPFTKSQRVSKEVVIDVDYVREHHQDPGYIYLISSGNGYQKIGRAVNVEARRGMLERDIPLEMTILHCFKSNYYIAAEKMMHEKYDAQRKKYEWFILKPEHINWIKAVKDYQFDGILESQILESLKV